MDARGVAVKEIEITEKTPSQRELASALKEHGKKAVFNSSGAAFRELDLRDKLESMSEREAAKLLASDGKLIKRPFLVVNESKTLLGFKEKEWGEL